MSQWARAVELAQMRFAEAALKAAISSATQEPPYLNEVVAVALEATQNISQPSTEASIRDPRAVLLNRIQRARQAKESGPSGGPITQAIAAWWVIRRVRQEAAALSRRPVPPSPEGFMTELRTRTNKDPLTALLRDQNR